MAKFPSKSTFCEIISSSKKFDYFWSSKMPFGFQFMLLFVLFPCFGSVCGSVHRTTGSAEPPNLTEPVVLPNYRTEPKVRSYTSIHDDAKPKRKPNIYNSEAKWVFTVFRWASYTEEKLANWQTSFESKNTALKALKLDLNFAKSGKSYFAHARESSLILAPQTV